MRTSHAASTLTVRPTVFHAPMEPPPHPAPRKVWVVRPRREINARTRLGRLATDPDFAHEFLDGRFTVHRKVSGARGSVKGMPLQPTVLKPSGLVTCRIESRDWPPPEPPHEPPPLGTAMPFAADTFEPRQCDILSRCFL